MNAGYHLIKKSNNKGVLAALGLVLVKSLPVIVELLSFVGTIALILVAGGIFLHNIEHLHHLFRGVPAIITEFALGSLAGLIVVLTLAGSKRVLIVLKK